MSLTAICLHCHRTINRRLVMAIGLSDQEKMGDLGAQCGQHIQAVHPAEMSRIAALTMQMTSLALASNFKCSDPLWQREMKAAAKAVGGGAGRVLLDADIEQIVAKTALGQDTMNIRDVLKLLKNQRDFLTYADVQSEAAETPQENILV